MDDCDKEGAGAVDPEKDFKGAGEGCTWFVAKVFVQAADDGCNGEPEGGEEEAFSVVAEGIEEVAVENESCSHEGTYDAEEKEVEDIDCETDLAEAGEGVGLVDDEDCQTACTHGEGIPGPGKVVQTVREAEGRVPFEHDGFGLGRGGWD